MKINRRTRVIGAFAALATALVTVSACGSGDGSASANAAKDNPYGLIQPGTIRVASLGDAKPYTFTDANGEFTGFDVELFKDVAHRAGVDDVVFTGQDFSGSCSPPSPTASSTSASPPSASPTSASRPSTSPTATWPAT